MCPSFEQTMPIPLAQSMGLPPPTATSPSQRLSWYWATPAMTSWSLGLEVTFKKRIGSISAWASWLQTASVQPTASTPGSLTTRTVLKAKLEA